MRAYQRPANCERFSKQFRRQKIVPIVNFTAGNPIHSILLPLNNAESKDRTALMPVSSVRRFSCRLFQSSALISRFGSKIPLVFGFKVQPLAQATLLQVSDAVVFLFNRDPFVFKALMFLGSGSVIHGMHEEQDVRKN